MAGKPLVRPLRFYILGMFFVLLKVCFAIGLVSIAVIASFELTSCIAKVTGSLMYSRFVAILLVLLWLSVILGAVVQFIDEQKAIAEEKRESMAKRPMRPIPPPPAPGPTIPPKQQ